MKTTWTKGLENDKKEELKGDFLRSHYIRIRLIDMLNEKIDTNRTATRTKDNYDKPNFGVIVADSIGYERALTEVISLLTNEEKEE